MWYVYNFFGDYLWYIAEKDALVVWQVLHVYDVVSDQQHELVELLAYLPVEDAQEIRLHFTPDDGAGSGG